MSKVPPGARITRAMSEIYALDADIRYHDARASELRKERQKFKAVVERAKLALERDAAARRYSESL